MTALFIGSVDRPGTMVRRTIARRETGSFGKGGEMRLMVYAMQSSGASLFTYFLAQRPGSLAIVDVFATSLCPSLETDEDVLVKCTIAGDHKLEDHAERFRPDATLLFLRDPVRNYLSLRTHWYRDHGGRIDDKFRLLEEH